nr:phospholipid carrier-dependent glycosyltransferase [Corynebacterium mendelii]
MVKSWIGPVTGGTELNPGYGLVVHPPLGKQLIAYSELIFGYTPLGWRGACAVAGSLTIVLIMLIARRLTGSTAGMVIAGVIATCDGVLLVGSRFGMLDIFLVVAVTAAVYFLLVDRDDVNQRLQEAQMAGILDCYGPGGPRLGVRWWRLAAGVCLGLALSVKWSGLYYMAVFGIVIVAADAAARARHGIDRPLVGAVIKDGFASFAALVIVPVLLYFWSFRAWFAQETSVYRHSFSTGKIPEDSWLRMLPEGLASFIDYHSDVLKFHGSITSSSGHSHPWDSKPWAWLASVRPVLYSSHTDIDCGTEKCRTMIYLFGTPAIWWVTVPVVLWAIWSVIIRHDNRFLIPLAGFAASFLPWLIVYDRQMYFFYAEPMVPFTILMITLVCLQVLAADTPRPGAGARQLTVPRVAVIAYLSLVVWMFVYFAPILYGIQITDTHYNWLMWMPSWH